MLRNRLIWLGLLIMSLVGISFYGGVVSYGFFFALILIPVISLVYLVLVFVFFKIYQKVGTSDIVAKENIPYYFTLQNEGFFSFASIKVDFYSDFSSIKGLDNLPEYELSFGDGIKKETILTCKYRGEYKVGINRVEIKDMFGLFKLSYSNKEPLRVSVKPNIVLLNSLNGIDVNEISANDSLVNPSYADVLTRDYVSGDDTRKIQWKQSAVLGKLLVKKDIGEERSSVAIAFSTYRDCEKESEYLPVESKILEITLALTLYFASEGIPVEQFYMENSPITNIVNNLDRFDEAYSDICSVFFSDENQDSKLYEALSKDNNLMSAKALFLIVSKIDDALLNFLDSLRGFSITAIIYLISDSQKEYDYDLGKDVIVYPISKSDDLTEVM